MMSKKYEVAMMTWYTYRNYGTALQATALYHVIDKLGYKTKIISYEPKGGLEEPVKVNFKWISEKLIDKISSDTEVYHSTQREKLFEQYLGERIETTNECKTFSELNDLNKEFDAFVCGSDQIWSPICYEDKYFLSFVDDSNKMIAYAPSLGTTDITDNIIKEKIRRNISRFKHLSVREQQGSELIKKLTNQIAKVVLDPTLLFDSLEWENYANVNACNKIEDEKYIICYFLGDSHKYMDYVKELSRKLDMPFYIIPVTTKDLLDKNKVPFEVGPSEFVSLVKNAQYVCTDSFHGMAFSINFNIPFSVFKRFTDNDAKNQNSRILSLLKILKLEKSLVDYDNFDEMSLIKTINFQNSNQILEQMRKESISYLEESLKAVCDCKNKLNDKDKYIITSVCCGCGACTTVCSQNAIEVKKNPEGFDHYFIDNSKCIKCGNCKTVCPMNNIVAPQIKKSKALYAVKSKSAEVLRQSSSGGVSYEISRDLQKEGFNICGCSYDVLQNSARHIFIKPNEKDKLMLLQGSKYIQSASADIMKKISSLQKEEKILYFGTPCQCAAVDKLLNKKQLRDNAIIVDLICHGIPSFHLWNKYLNDINKQYHVGKHPDVVFRNKEYGWRKRQIRINGNNHHYKRDERKDDFYAFFRSGLCNMNACFECPYREKSAADIRIGDYWGDRFKKDRQGVSMVIANTDKGQKVILNMKNSCEISEYNLEDFWNIQYPYNQVQPLVREQVIEELKQDERSMHALRKEYCGYYDFIERLAPIRRKLEKWIRRG